MTQNGDQSTNWMVQVIVPIIVALIGAGALWEFVGKNFFKSTSDNSCIVTNDALIISKPVIETEQSMPVSIRVENAEIYNWSAMDGKMEPSGESRNATSTYTSPSVPVRDTIKVSLQLKGCNKPVLVEQRVDVIRKSNPNPSPSPSSPVPNSSSSLPNNIVGGSQSNLPVSPSSSSFQTMNPSPVVAVSPTTLQQSPEQTMNAYEHLLREKQCDEYASTYSSRFKATNLERILNYCKTSSISYTTCQQNLIEQSPNQARIHRQIIIADRSNAGSIPKTSIEDKTYTLILEGNQWKIDQQEWNRKIREVAPRTDCSVFN